MGMHGQRTVNARHGESKRAAKGYYGAGCTAGLRGGVAVRAIRGRGDSRTSYGAGQAVGVVTGQRSTCCVRGAASSPVVWPRALLTFHVLYDPVALLQHLVPSLVVLLKVV